jgi:8-oxo-dGTP pyrophosphatase MutT (NUDIX family)
MEVPPEQYYAQLARARRGAGALITTSDGRVVMIDTTYRDFYEIPGGAVESGESPPDACARECREELGRDVPVGRLLAVDHQSDGGHRTSTLSPTSRPASARPGGADTSPPPAATSIANPADGIGSLP